MSKSLATLAVLLTLTIGTSHARSSQPPTPEVDLVIALDVSGSMSGLIDSARQRLWDVVNEFGQAQPQPDLRIAIITFGNPAYGTENGFVRINQPFTNDLDAINQTLFSFQTNGGDEYVARALHRSLTELQWRDSQSAIGIVFVAGNESAGQDPQYSVKSVLEQARSRDVVINALYCGAENDADSAGWRELSTIGGGFYASIDQNAAAVANIETPMDEELLKLNQALNSTYVAYGDQGKLRSENQVRQDANAASMSKPTAVSRVVAKAGTLYDATEWDLVDALEAGQSLEDIEEEALPAPMQSMDPAQRQAHIEQKAQARRELKKEIAALDNERREWINDAREQSAKDAGPGLDQAIVQGLREITESRGLSFKPESGNQ